MSFFDPPLLMPPRELWRAYFGKPDGILVVARCRLLGHNWERCEDACCDGEWVWCSRCATRSPWRPPAEASDA